MAKAKIIREARNSNPRDIQSLLLHFSAHCTFLILVAEHTIVKLSLHDVSVTNFHAPPTTDD
jgi:hypothetical protein